MTSFRPELAQLVAEGKKTQTRRLIGTGEVFIKSEDHPTIARVEIHKPGKSPRIKWQTGKRYAVQPGRGKPAIAHFRLIDLWREDVRQISKEDALAEGFSGQLEFLGIWMEINTRKAHRYTAEEIARAGTPIAPWVIWMGRAKGYAYLSDEEAVEYMNTLPLALFNAHALRFEPCP